MDDYNLFLELHKTQLETSNVPELFWKTLHHKLSNQIFDAGDKFSIFLIDYGEDGRDEGDPLYRVYVSSVNGISVSDPEHIYLIDHAFTFASHELLLHLQQVPGLCERLGKFIGCENMSRSDLISEIHLHIWKFSQPYSVSNGPSIEDRMPVWYIMDEFGSAIQHSDNPNFRVVPFIHCPEGMTYSILFPVSNVVHNEEVTRNYIEGCMSVDDDTKEALLLPWFPKVFKHLKFEQDEPEDEYFLHGHIEETLPDLTMLRDVVTDKMRIFKVYADYKYIHQYLKHPQFIMTNCEDEADILFYTSHFKNFLELSQKYSSKYVNQFPFEHVLTVKDLLSVICRRKIRKGTPTFDSETLETYPSWLPTTFNLKTELPKFVSYFQQRDERGLDNHWICKPWNLARGLDMTITNNLNHILRLPFTGPKIAQKYICNPVLFWRADVACKVKFDVRYVILLKSVKPLIAYAYKNFFLRFSNKPFELSDFDDYEKHFTVMNYDDKTPLCKMLHYEFILEFEKQYPDQNWESVEQDIFSMFREVLESAAQKNPPCGVAHSPQSRAIFATDLMLEWQSNSNSGRFIQPKLLEINWTPDCRRACEYYPEFYNDIFSLLFIDQENSDVFHPL